MRTDFGYFEEKKIGRSNDAKMLRRLYPFTRPYRWWLSGSILLVILIALFDLTIPYITKVAVDRYIVPAVTVNDQKARYLEADPENDAVAAVLARHPSWFLLSDGKVRISYENLKKLPAEDLARLRQSDIDGLAGVSVLFLVVVIAGFILNFLQVMLMETGGQMIMHDIRTALFRHVQGLSVAFFTRNPVGRLVTRVTNDIQNMNELFTSVIAFVFKDLFLLIGITIALFIIHLKLALICFALLPFILLAATLFSTLAREVFRTLRIKIAEINTRIAETIGGMTVIQLFCRERENSDSFHTLNHEHYQAGMRQVHIFAIFMPVIEMLSVIALSIVIYKGGAGVLEGSISLGALIAFISYIKMFFRPIRDIAEKYNILQNAMASAERIFLLFDTHDRIDVAPAGNTAPGLAGIRRIRFDKVSFGYIENEPVLKNIDLTIEAGEVVAVIGPTGSGKTSLIHLIPRFYDPAGGRITINDRNIMEIDPSVLRSKIALVTQDPFLFSLSIRANIIPDHNRDANDAEIERILDLSDCRSLIDRLPEGIETIVSEGGASISSGERQLLSIARAFAHQPELIIFDEATSYIDSGTEQRIQRALNKLMQNRTTLLVAHRLTTARHADRIIVLNKGRVVENGNHDQLMSRRGFYYRLSRLQG